MQKKSKPIVAKPKGKMKDRKPKTIDHKYEGKNLPTLSHCLQPKSKQKGWNPNKYFPTLCKINTDKAQPIEFMYF